MARTVLLVAALTLFAMPADAQPSAALLWKARALQAGKALTALQGQIERIPRNQWNSKEAIQIRCEVMLESAYATHITMEDVAHKTDGDTDFFRLVLSGGQEHGLFDLVYVYSRGQLVAARVDLLPKGWRLFLFGDTSVQLLLPSPAPTLRASEGCIFHFDLREPFSARVVR